VQQREEEDVNPSLAAALRSRRRRRKHEIETATSASHCGEKEKSTIHQTFDHIHFKDNSDDVESSL